MKNINEHNSDEFSKKTVCRNAGNQFSLIAIECFAFAKALRLCVAASAEQGQRIQSE
jgi:hypothetical protein